MKRLSLLLLLSIWSTLGYAQLMGFKVPADKKRLEIPFEFKNNLILIKVIFNKVFPLTFILDTGSENTILAKKKFADLLELEYDREYKVYGADLQKELTVHLSRNVRLKLPTLKAQQIPLLVLEEDYFQFEQYTGLKIHGILGMDLFKLVVVQIDYKNRKLILHHPETFIKPSKKFKAFPVEIYRNKPYITVQAAVQNNDPIPLKLLIDTGANMTLLLHNNSDSTITLPPKLIPGKLGDGLGGLIEGYLGRINSLSIGDFAFSNITTHFQELPSELDNSYINSRNGILGNGILSRFNFIYAPFQRILYLKAEKKYNKGFRFDRSGITFIASGVGLDNYSITEVLPDSPASEAGLQKGDQLHRLNGFPARYFSLESIAWKLQKRVGKRYKMVVKRNGEKKKFVFRLRDLI